MNETEELLTTGEAARLLGVHPDTVRRAQAAGKIRAARTPGGDRRFRRSELEAYAAELGNLSGDDGAA